MTTATTSKPPRILARTPKKFIISISPDQYYKTWGDPKEKKMDAILDEAIEEISTSGLVEKMNLLLHKKFASC